MAKSSGHQPALRVVDPAAPQLADDLFPMRGATLHQALLHAFRAGYGEAARMAQMVSTSRRLADVLKVDEEQAVALFAAKLEPLCGLDQTSSQAG